MNKFLLLSIIFTLFSGFLLAQYNNNNSIDSLTALSRKKTYKLQAHKQLSWIYRTSDTDSALFHGKIAYDIASKENNHKEKASILNYIGIIYRNKGNYYQATTSFKKALKISKKYNIFIEQAYSYNNLGDIYERLNNTLNPQVKKNKFGTAQFLQKNMILQQEKFCETFFLALFFMFFVFKFLMRCLILIFF